MNKKKFFFKYLFFNKIECKNLLILDILNIRYLIYKSFYVFIPRVEVYLWFDFFLNWKYLNQDLTILELGIGTGILSLFLKKKKNNYIIYGIDINLFSIKLCVYNSRLNFLNINLFLKNWLNNFNYKKKFNLIISNPPYIYNKKYHQMKLFDPYISLYSKNYGYFDIYKIISFSRFFLYKKSFLIIEHAFNQGYIIRKILKKFFFKFVFTIQDYNGLDRITIGQYY